MYTAQYEPNSSLHPSEAPKNPVRSVPSNAPAKLVHKNISAKRNELTDLSNHPR